MTMFLFLAKAEIALNLAPNLTFMKNADSGFGFQIGGRYHHSLDQSVGLFGGLDLVNRRVSDSVDVDSIDGLKITISNYSFDVPFGGYLDLSPNFRILAGGFFAIPLSASYTIEAGGKSVSSSEGLDGNFFGGLSVRAEGYFLQVQEKPDLGFFSELKIGLGDSFTSEDGEDAGDAVATTLSLGVVYRL